MSSLIINIERKTNLFCVSDGSGNPFVLAAALPPPRQKIVANVATRDAGVAMERDTPKI